MRPIETVLSKLENIREETSGYRASCPVEGHGKGRGDLDPSLSVSEAEDGRVLIKCGAGCPSESVLDRLNLRWHDLFQENGNGHVLSANGSSGSVGERPKPSKPRRIAETYDYIGEAGELLFQAVRYEPKGFSQRRPDGHGGWITKGVFSDIEPVLYRLPQVLEAARSGGTVYIPEGERDVHRLEQERLTATTSPMGAGKWRESYSDVMKGVHAVIFPDNDEPGRKHARMVAESLYGKAASVKVVELPGLPQGGDVSDWLDGGGMVQELLRLVEDALEWTPESDEPASPSPSLYKEEGWGRKPRAVRFRDMEPPGPRHYLLEGLVPVSYVTLLHGDGGVAKSLQALSLGIAVASGSGKWLGREVEGGPVLYLDFELDESEQARRVHQLCRGQGLDAPPDDLHYMSALGFRSTDTFDAAREVCKEHRVKLVILDSFGPAFEGDSEASRDVIGFFQRVAEPFRALGVTLIIIDHQSRLQPGQNYQSKSAFGSVYKGNLARSVIQAEPTERGEGTLTVRLRQKKHNFGPLAEPFGATLTFSAESVTLEAVELGAAELAEEATLNSRDRVKLALEDGPAYPWELAEATGLAEKTVKNALTELRKQGEVEPTGEKENRAEQVRLCVPASLSYKGDGDGDGSRSGDSQETSNVVTLRQALSGEDL